MNSGTREVATNEYLRIQPEAIAAQFDVPIDPANLSRAHRRALDRDGITRVSRNAKCPCGSKKRFRKCHGRKP